MAATPSIVIKTTIPYRGQTKTFSNRYHFSGGTPADLTHWNTFSDAIVAAYKLIITSGLTIVGSYYYGAGSNVPIGSKTYSQAGTATLSGTPCTGDSAMMLRFATAARSAKNHPVYLWNWFHGANWSGSGSSDTLLAAQRTLVQTYAAAWISGFSDGSVTYVRAGPNGANATGYVVDQFVRHRDFPN
jgi:hypothetical protein